jgi:hypothetical protein
MTNESNQLNNSKKHNGGRPARPVDWPLIDRLANMQCTEEEIGYVCDVSVRTLQRHSLNEKHCSLNEYISKQTVVGKISLRRWMWEKAESGNVTMQIWLSKNILGYADKVEHSGAGNGPIEIIVRWDGNRNEAHSAFETATSPTG